MRFWQFRFWQVSLILGLVLLVGYVYLAYTFTLDTGPVMQGNYPIERLTIPEVYYNSTENAIFASAQKVSSNSIHIGNAEIRNASGIYVYSDNTINLSLTTNEITIVRILANSTMPKGDYTITLVTDLGSRFVSPTFNVP